MVGAVKVISGTAHPELAQGICKRLGTDLFRTTVVRFSNENMLVQIDENVREADVFVIQPSCPPVSDGIIALSRIQVGVSAQHRIQPTPLRWRFAAPLMQAVGRADEDTGANRMRARSFIRAPSQRTRPGPAESRSGHRRR